jgi:platelet-activating factor acetylhydrolase
MTSLPAPTPSARGLAPTISPEPTEDATATGIATSQQAIAAVAAPSAAAELAPPPAAPKVHRVRRSAFGALLSRTLPNYTGAYSVGVCDMEVPVAPRTFGNFKHKSMPDQASGLTLDTVLFSVFYPCERQPKQVPVVWFPA